MSIGEIKRCLEGCGSNRDLDYRLRRQRQMGIRDGRDAVGHDESRVKGGCRFMKKDFRSEMGLNKP